jgi:hypothetical protein
MSLRPDPKELAARARADLRMGVPVVLWDVADRRRWSPRRKRSRPRGSRDLQGLGTAPVLAITPRRAETLKARAYSDHVARIILPRGRHGLDPQRGRPGRRSDDADEGAASQRTRRRRAICPPRSG